MRTDLDLNSLAVNLRRDWEIDAYSPLDIFSIVLSKFPNLTILYYPMSENTSGMCINENNIQLIAINSHHSKGRQRFTLAHELYHLLYEEKSDERFVCIKNSDYLSEIEANAFASFLLMPDEALKRYIKSNVLKWDLDTLILAEQYFQISHRGFLLRLKKANQKFDSSLWDIKITDEAKKRGFSDELYVKRNGNYFVLGKYVKMIDDLDKQDLISESKKRELLLDGYRGDLVFYLNEENNNE